MFDWLILQFKTNQFMTGAIGGSISFAALNYTKSFFISIWFLIKNFFIREITILSSKNENYYNAFVTFVSSRIKYPKNIKVDTKYSEQYGKYICIKNIGYGSNWFVYNWYTFVRVNISVDESNHSDRITETIKLYFIGLKPRSQRNKFYDEFLNNHNNNENRPTYNKLDAYGYSKIKEIKNRNIESIFIEKEKIDKIDSSISNLSNLSNNTIYNKIGIPKTLGVLLYGPPGTGKTSLIQAFATKYCRSIYFADFSINTKSILNSTEVLSQLPENSFVVLEDIDCHESTHNRINKSEKDSSDLATILRILDGSTLSEGTVIWATTNNIDILDPALIRDGRFDIKIECGPADKCMAQKMIEYLDPSKLDLLDKLTFPISQAELQNKILR